MLYGSIFQISLTGRLREKSASASFFYAAGRRAPIMTCNTPHAPNTLGAITRWVELKKKKVQLVGRKVQCCCCCCYLCGLSIGELIFAKHGCRAPALCTPSSCSLLRTPHLRQAKRGCPPLGCSQRTPALALRRQQARRRGWLR